MMINNQHELNSCDGLTKGARIRMPVYGFQDYFALCNETKVNRGDELTSYQIQCRLLHFSSLLNLECYAGTQDHLPENHHF